jgi:S1-C subfamily serine protease
MMATLSLLLCLVTGCKHEHIANKSIVMLVGSTGAQCTGFEVKAPSGHEYMLTAGHCAMLADPLTGSIQVTTEEGAKVMRRVIAVDPLADITIMEPVPGIPALEVAADSYKDEFIRILGHGLGLPTWEVDCRIVGDTIVNSDLGWNETICSAEARPGHSGSPALDPDGHVVGVLSVAGMGISGFSRLVDLQDFLKGY